MMAACPALAVVDNNNNQCIDTNLGTASGSTALEAIWGLNNYQCSGGQYFDTSTATCVQCTSNNYCPGGTYNVESQTNGLNACPNGYAMSVAGASADTDCYRACTTTDVAHSTAVTGGYYYGDNNQCLATSCAIGWHVSNTDNFPSNPINSAYVYVNPDGTTGRGITAPAQYTAEYYGINANGTWAASFSDFGDIRGSAYCSAKSGDTHIGNTYYGSGGVYGGDSSDWTATMAELSSATGEIKYCWCQIDGLRPTGEGWIGVESPSWVLYGQNNTCDSSCANSCASKLLSSYFREALFSPLGECDLTDYVCGVGQYFDTTTATCVQCTSNNYCPGGTYNVESQTNGLNSCPNGYGLSAAGASADTDCYRTCTTGDVAHSLAVSGGYYYGDNNRCSATSCAAGWHVKNGTDFTDPSNVPSNPANSAYAYVNLNGVTGYGPGQASPAQYTAGYYGISANGTWGATFTDYGDIRGNAYCSAQPNTANSGYGVSSMGVLSGATGEAKYCWCQIDGLRPTGSDSWENLSSPSWVFYGTVGPGSGSGCVSLCANVCAGTSQNMRFDFRNVLFSTVYIPASCEANNIVINWYNEQILHDTNQCTYNETITLPEQPNKTGYTFSGWKIKAVPNNN